MAKKTTCDLCDEFEAQVRVSEPVWKSYGGKRAFAGTIRTIKCHEDNSRVQELIAESGRGNVLVVDGGGSLRRSLLGDNLAAKAVACGWEGIVIYGALRDVDALAVLDLGILALACVPMRTEKKGVGEIDVEVRFAGVTFTPGHWLFADANGLIVAERPLMS